MESCEKCCQLNELIRPFVFFYNRNQDVISSAVDAGQRRFGYSALYDRTVVYFNIGFDCEPVYFDYDSRIWLIEFWKGQYRINAKSEIGIYYANTVLSGGTSLVAYRFSHRAIPRTRYA